jgi:hypothetical protein
VGFYPFQPASGGGGSGTALGWYVVGSGTGQYSTIQDAINAAQEASASQGDDLPQLAPTVFIPYTSAGYLISSPLTLAASEPIRITGDNGTRLYSTSGDIFNFGYNYIQGLEIDHLTLDATGGHIFDEAQLKFCRFHDLQLRQRSAGYGIWNQSGASAQCQNTSFTDCRFWVAGDPSTGQRTVPGWVFSSAGSETIAELWFTRVQGFNLANNSLLDTSQYLFEFDYTGGSTFSWISHINFSDCSFHNCLGGVINGLSVAHATHTRCSVYDVYNQGGQALEAWLYNYGAAAGGSGSRGLHWQDCMRSQGIAPASYGDIYVASTSSEITVIGYTPAFYNAGWDGLINLNGAAKAHISECGAGLTVDNPASDTVIIGPAATTSGIGAGLPPAAPAVATSAAPTGTESTTLVMCGIGQPFTPSGSGIVLVVATGGVINSTSGANTEVIGRYGTGTAPANGAAVTGTAWGAGATPTWTGPGATTKQDAFALTDILTLTPGTAYWFDLAQASTSGSVTSGVQNVKIVLVELP